MVFKPTIVFKDPPSPRVKHTVVLEETQTPEEVLPPAVFVVDFEFSSGDAFTSPIGYALAAGWADRLEIPEEDQND